MDKQKRLNKLKEILDKKGYFVFEKLNKPGCKKVKGFLGTDKIFFVCQKPSTGKFGRDPDQLFYRSLQGNMLQNVHITDLSKKRGNAVKSISQHELKRQLPYLEKEIKIIKPKIIVAVGNNAFDELNKLAMGGRILKGIRLYRIYHYAWATRYKKDRYKKEKLFNQQIKGIKEYVI